MPYVPEPDVAEFDVVLTTRLHAHSALDALSQAVTWAADEVGRAVWQVTDLATGDTTMYDAEHVDFAHVWHDHEPDTFLPPGCVCRRCGHPVQFGRPGDNAARQGPMVADTPAAIWFHTADQTQVCAGTAAHRSAEPEHRHTTDIFEVCGQCHLFVRATPGSAGEISHIHELESDRVLADNHTATASGTFATRWVWEQHGPAAVRARLRAEGQVREQTRTRSNIPF